MGLFNYIDTFFFISLGITFILILLLVFHFKQQIISLEHKNDTMFEIINNIVKELTALKTAFIQSSLSRENEFINTSVQCVPPKINVENKIVISDSDDDTSYTSGQSETDSDSETDNDSDSETDDEDNVVERIVAIENIDIHETTEEPSSKSNEIKVINIELNNVVDSIDNSSEIEDETDNLEEENHIEDFVNNETIVVEKVDSSENLGTSEPIESLSTTENNKEVYRKMSLQALKTLVITKGLSSDTSKMKKNDLLKLLESE